jgi:hypothetical protein
LAAAVQALCLTWGGAALVSWYTWSSASDFWTVFGRPVPAGLRSEDDRLFLQDAFVTSLAAAIAVVTVLVVARRRPSTAVAAAWVLAAFGALLWIGPVASVPENKDAQMDCGMPTVPKASTCADGH